jgi:predicted nucleotidyltransferase
MQALTKDREEEVDRLIQLVAGWASERPDLRGAALVGSWARRSARMDSDVDVILLTDDPPAYIDAEEWTQGLGAIAIIRTQQRGILTERRLAMPGGLQVDVGVVSPSWASIPIDRGTLRVISNGIIPLYDRDQLLATLLAADLRTRKE